MSTPTEPEKAYIRTKQFEFTSRKQCDHLEAIVQLIAPKLEEVGVQVIYKNIPDLHANPMRLKPFLLIIGEAQPLLRFADGGVLLKSETSPERKE